MDDLDQFAHCQALFWAELVFSDFVSHGLELPKQWPGSIEQARLLVAFSAGHEFEGQRERLVTAVHHRVRFLWQEFRSFRAA